MEAARKRLESLSVSYSIDISLIELLPSELFHSILDYIPESLPNVRLTSKTLKSRTDEHIHTTKASVKNLGFGRTDGIIHVVFEARQDTQFALLHLKLRLCQKPVPTSIKHMSRIFLPQERVRHYVNVDTATEGASGLEYLNGVIGRIECAGFNDPVLDDERTLIRGVKMHTVGTTIETLSDDNMKLLMGMIEEHEVAELKLSTSSVACSDPVSALLDLSSVLKALHIGHTGHFFGRQDFDWAPIFLDMLSRRIDKLVIRNTTHPGFLSLSSADALIKGIPSLPKQVWFESTCTAYCGGFQITRNEYIIRAACSSISEFWTEPGSLKIIHSSRCPEEMLRD